MSQDLLHLALGYELQTGTSNTPSEALVSELDSRLLPVAGGLMRLRLLHDAVQCLEQQLLRDVRSIALRLPLNLASSLHLANSWLFVLELRSHAGARSCEEKVA